MVSGLRWLVVGPILGEPFFFFFLLQSPFVEGDEQLVRGARIGVVIKLATGSLPYGLSDRKASVHGNRIRLCYPSKVTRPF